MDDNKFENDIFEDNNEPATTVDDLFEEILEDESTEQTIEELTDDSDFILEDTFEVEEVSTEVPITVKELEIEDKKQKNKGLKAFIAILCFLLAISIAACAGYIVGSSNKKNSSNGITLESKPDIADKMSIEEVYNFVNPSVVGITVYNSEGVKGYASGVVYSEDGLIITNDHIYEDIPDAKFKIHDYDGNAYDARYVAGDTRSDLAVLKINSDGFFAASFGNSDEINFGEAVVAIGRPSSPTDNSSITSGIVSYPNRRVTNSTNYSSRLIQTDSAINPGSSGGALVNMYGQVIGITSSKLVGDSYEGVGYAIPTATVKKIVESLVENGKVVNRARLGFTYQEVTAVSVDENEVSYGLRVVSVSEDSDMFGKVFAGDIITTVNGKKIITDDILIDLLETVLPGDTLTLEILNKSGDTKQIRVKVLQDTGTSSYTTSEEDLPLLPKP